MLARRLGFGDFRAVAVLLLPAGVAAFLPGERSARVLIPAFFFVFCFCAGFSRALYALAEAEPAGAFAAPSGDCPATGSIIIKKKSKPARQQDASRKMEVGEDETLISLL